MSERITKLKYKKNEIIETIYPVTHVDAIVGNIMLSKVVNVVASTVQTNLWGNPIRYKVPQTSSGNTSIVMLINAENTSSTGSEKYLGIMEMNILATGSNQTNGSNLNWLVVHGFEKENFHLRHLKSADEILLWVKPTVENLTITILSETTNGEATNNAILIDKPALTTVTSTTIVGNKLSYSEFLVLKNSTPGTDLGITKTGTTNTITSSTGTSAEIAGATTTQAGLVTTGEQNISGEKTFRDGIIIPGSNKYIDLGNKNNWFWTRFSGENWTFNNTYTGGGWARNLMEMKDAEGNAYFRIGAQGSSQNFSQMYIGPAYNDYWLSLNNDRALFRAKPQYASNPTANNDLTRKLYVDNKLDDKVDKVSGKGLSTNDLTNTLKTKLDGIEEGAQVNPYSKSQLDNLFNGKANDDEVVRATTEDKNILGTTQGVFNISEKKVWFNKGALFYGTAADAGLVTRGISGTNANGTSKDHLYLNYDGPNSNNILSRQIVLGGNSPGTDRGNGIYDYSAVRGDAFIAYLNGTLGSYVKESDISAWSKTGNSDTIPTSKLPSLAITDTFEVATQSAMTNLTAQKGDIAIRTDLNKTFVLAAEPASTLGNWKELRTPTDAVLSVAGLTGAITSSSLKTSLSLNNVQNKSSATIRGEITSANVTSALGFTPAPSSHNHEIAQINGLQTALNNKANNDDVVKLSGAQTISGRKDFSDQIHITKSESSSPGLVIEGTRANARYINTGATGGVAALVLDGQIRNTSNNTSRVLSVGMYGGANPTGNPTSTYMYLDSRPDGSWNNATLKVDSQNRVGIAIEGSNRPTQALDVNGKIRMRTETVDTDGSDIVVTKGYLGTSIDKVLKEASWNSSTKTLVLEVI